MNLEEQLIARWISEEAASEQIIQRTEGGYVYHGNQNDYIIEVKALRVSKETVRLREPFQNLGGAVTGSYATEEDLLGYN